MKTVLTISNKLIDLKGALPAIRQATLRKVADEVFKESQELVPVLTGELKQSGKIDDSVQDRVVVSYGEGLPDERAASREFGTVFQEATPYLIPAVERVDLEEIATEELKARL